ncbi:hypothetical protein R3P38DRAFT_2802804 [Favolaschia claudopus]|uniref:Uncharacterized protein n=1 Tax=Favolaschia claudopus TaxID=2862362 RepID=A0AAV9ZV67_9AGAR
MPMQTRNGGKRPSKARPTPKSSGRAGRKKAAAKKPALSRHSPSPALSAADEGSDYQDGNEEEEDDAEPDGEGDGDAGSGEGTLSQNALNAQAKRWESWQDRVLVQQANNDRPFLLDNPQERAAGWDNTATAVNATVSKTARKPWSPRTGEACRKRLKRLIDEYKAGEAVSLKQTGINEEVDHSIVLLGEIAALADGEVIADSRKAKKKQDLEAQSGAEMRAASMRGLVNTAALCDLSSLDGATARERQAQRGGKRKREEKENPSQSSNATNKHRKKALGAFQDVLNTRLDRDEQTLAAVREEDKVRHDQQLDVLKSIADRLERVDNGLSNLRDEQEKTNALLREQELDRREAQIRRREEELQMK